MYHLQHSGVYETYTQPARRKRLDQLAIDAVVGCSDQHAFMVQREELIEKSLGTEDFDHIPM